MHFCKSIFTVLVGLAACKGAELETPQKSKRHLRGFSQSRYSFPSFGSGPSPTNFGGKSGTNSGFGPGPATSFFSSSYGKGPVQAYGNAFASAGSTRPSTRKGNVGKETNAFEFASFGSGPSPTNFGGKSGTNSRFGPGPATSFFSSSYGKGPVQAYGNAFASVGSTKPSTRLVPTTPSAQDEEQEADTQAPEPDTDTEAPESDIDTDAPEPDAEADTGTEALEPEDDIEAPGLDADTEAPETSEPGSGK